MPSKRIIEIFFDVSPEDNVATEAGAQNFLASKFRIDQSKPEGQKLYFKTKFGNIGIGSFITPTIAKMEEMLHKESNEITWSLYRNTTNGASLGNALDMHYNCKDAIVMGAASQPNCLEMGSPSVKPSHGVDGYMIDRTQGPACALSTTMNLLFRQYLLPVEAKTGLMSNKYVNENGLLNEERLFSEFQKWIQNKNNGSAIDEQQFGQHDDRQLNCLKPFQEKLIELGLNPNDGSREFFIYNNGYTFPKDISPTGAKPIKSELDRINEFLLRDPNTGKERSDAEKDELRESLINSFAVGITTDAKFACGYDGRILSGIDGDKVIDQVWVSALPIGYDSQNKINQIDNIRNSVHGIEAWEPLAKLALVAAAKAQLIQGARLNARLIKVGKITEGAELQPTYLTKVGGGVFKNPEEWIAESIAEAASSLKKKFPKVSFAAELSHWDGLGNINKDDGYPKAHEALIAAKYTDISQEEARSHWDGLGNINKDDGYPKAHEALIAAKYTDISQEEARWKHYNKKQKNIAKTSTAVPFSDSTSANTSPAHLIDRNKWIGDRVNLSVERERAINPAEELFNNLLVNNLTSDDCTKIDNFLRLMINSSGSNTKNFFVSARSKNSTFILEYFYEEDPVPDNLVEQAISIYRDELNIGFLEKKLRERALDSMFESISKGANSAKYQLKGSPIKINCDHYYDLQTDFAQSLTTLSDSKPFAGCVQIIEHTSDDLVKGSVSQIVEGWFDRDESKPMSAEDLYTQEKKAYLILNESAHWLSIEIAFKKDVRGVGVGVVEVNYSNPSGGQQSGCSENVESFIKKVVGFLELVVNAEVASHVQDLSEFSSYKEAVNGFVNDDQKNVLEAQNVTIQEKHLLEQGTRAGCGPAAKANLALLMGDKVRIGKVEISIEDFDRGASIGERGLILLPEDELRLRLQDRYEIFQADDEFTDNRCGVSGVDFKSFKDLQVIQDYIVSIDEEQVSPADDKGKSDTATKFNSSPLLSTDRLSPAKEGGNLREANKKSLMEEFDKIKVLRNNGDSSEASEMKDWLKEEKNKDLKIMIDSIPNKRSARNKKIKEEEEKTKVFSGDTLGKDRNYERFVDKDFQSCDMKDLFRATFLKCTFDENCKLPTDLSSLEPKYFSQCKIHASLFDGDVGQNFKKKFEEKFKLVKEGDFYVTPKNERKYVPKSSPTNPTASSLTDQSRGLGGPKLSGVYFI